MGDIVVSRSEKDVLAVVGLGSCIGVALVCPERSVAGLAHVVLPDSAMTRGREAPAGKFADTAIIAMVSEFRKYRVGPEQLVAILVGGSAMFGLSPRSKLAGVGDRNVEAVRSELAVFGIPVVGEDVGGIHGRSVQVFVGESRVLARSGNDEPLEFKASYPGLTANGRPRKAQIQHGSVGAALAAANAHAKSINDQLTA